MTPALPPLGWEPDSGLWTGPVVLPWYRTADPPALDLVPADDPDPAAGPPAGCGPEHLEAFRRVAAASDRLRAAVLSGFRLHVRELRGADWAALEGFFALTGVRIFPVARDGVAYVGLTFSCLQFTHGYEHGVGIVVCGDRIVRFGVADVAMDETAALADLDRRG